MKNIISVLTISLALASVANAQLVLDGSVGDLGTPVASDAYGIAGEGNGNAVMDLKDLYVKEDAGIIHIGLTVNADLAANWGKYTVFIQTNNGGAGSTTHPWGRNMGADGVNFSPQYCISTWLDGDPAGGSTMYHWNGSSWDDMSADHSFAWNASAGSIEWRVPRNKIGNAGTLKCVASCTGNGGGDNGQDAVPSHANATAWDYRTVFDTPSGTVNAPVALSGFAVE